MKNPDWLEPMNRVSSCDENLYSLDNLKTSFYVEKLLCEQEAYFVLNNIDEFWFKFAILSFHSSEFNGDNTILTMVFHGEGPTGSLRECRHTYWGEEGYMFYLKKDTIVSALEKLSEYYDLD